MMQIEVFQIDEDKEIWVSRVFPSAACLGDDK